MKIGLENASGILDNAGGTVLTALIEIFTQWSLYLGLSLLLVAVVSSVFTKKVPWTREMGIWLYFMAAAGCFFVYWTEIPR